MTASRLNSSVYRLLRLLLLPTWHYFLWNLTSQSLGVQHQGEAPAGNVTQISDTTTLAGTGKADTQCFTYDGHQRLTEAWTPADANCAPENRTTANLGGAAPYWTGYTYNTAGQRATETTHTANGSTTATY